MADQSLKNKKIIISAGASGIGLAIVKICLSRGAIVFVNDLNQKFSTYEIIVGNNSNKDIDIILSGRKNLYHYDS